MAATGPAQAMRTSRILWLALLAAQGLYVALLLSGVARLRGEPLEIPALPLALAGVAVATGVGAHGFWRRASGTARPVHAAPDPASAFTSYLLAWVLDESIGIHGLVLGLLGFGPGVWAPFSAAGLALTLLHRPAGPPLQPPGAGPGPAPHDRA